MSFYSASTHEVEVAWRNTVRGSLWRSRHVLFVGLLNAINVLAVASMWRELARAGLDTASLSTYAVVYLFGIAAVNLYGWRLRQQTASSLEGASSAHAVDILNTSYLGYRLLVMALGLPGLVLDAVILLPHH